jgi:hypothetical protein
VPLLDLIDRLPLPQRDALATVFGLSAGAVPDRFLVGLATLTLLAEAAEQQSLLCIIDDAQWLDDASAQILVYDATRSAVWLSAMPLSRRGTGGSARRRWVRVRSAWSPSRRIAGR